MNNYRAPKIRESYSRTLLPCPFCGVSKARLINPSLPRVMCFGCNAQTGAAATAEEAIAAWNTRALAAAARQSGEKRDKRG